MKNALKWIFLGLLVAGAVVAALTDIPIAEYSAIAVAFVSAAALCVTTYKKSEKKGWKVIAAIVLIAVGAFGLGFMGVAPDAISKIIAAVGGVVLLLFGIIVGVIQEKKK